ncbi:AAA ATPase [Candidatus Symbiothrix dinenymphae]|nr:AAA ATPase [Candidatus Symbiothrix dinenymphae]
METKTVKRLPYGNSNFKSIMTENYAYVDKTRFVEQLENEANKYQFFIRPRKFGKSLFSSLLENYYDVNRAKDFDKLFGGLYIGKHPTPKKNAYAVLKFDFSGIDTSDEDRFRVSFSGKIQNAVRRFVDVYRNLFPDADSFIQRLDAGKQGILSIQSVIDKVEPADVKIFVIIDEYDHFANDLIAMGSQLGKDVYHNMVHANGLVRDFYEALKTGTNTVIDRIFITGISPVMLDDLTSGFNIAVNLTLEPKYNEMMGFTQQEVDALMHETGVDPNFVNVDMETYYNGYLFHEDGEHRVYNPSMILYFFYQILTSQKPPKNIIDDNLKTDYNRLRRMVQNEENRNTLIEIVQNNGIMSDVISKFSIDRLEDTKYFISLLFYMGLLTVDKYHDGRLYLKIPNYSIRTVYWEYLEQLTLEWNKDVMIDLRQQTDAVWQLAYPGNLRPYIEYVSKNIFSRLSNRDLQHFNEKHIKIMLLNGLFQSKLYVPRTEKEVENGYIDIFLQRSPLLPDIKYEWVWELKYLKKGDRKALHSARNDARAQLEKYRNSREFAERADVRFASIIFIGKDKFEIG